MQPECQKRRRQWTDSAVKTEDGTMLCSVHVERGQLPLQQSVFLLQLSKALLHPLEFLLLLQPGLSWCTVALLSSLSGLGLLLFRLNNKFRDTVTTQMLTFPVGCHITEIAFQSKVQTTHEQDTQTGFLLLWPWPRYRNATWPRYSVDIGAYRNWKFQDKTFEM